MPHLQEYSKKQNFPSPLGIHVTLKVWISVLTFTRIQQKTKFSKSLRDTCNSKGLDFCFDFLDDTIIF